MSRTYEGKLTAAGIDFGIAISRTNSLVTERLLSAALDVLKRHGADDARLRIAWVPGAFELPLVVKRFAESQKVRAVIALGCVVRGGTPHFDFIAGEVTRGCGDVQRTTGVPVAFGVLTTDTLDQALDRAGGKHGNKGADAALAAIEMVNLLAELKE
ncbi:MAG: 6,7-dimethyl-8-ribityllumazine synthase [Deltaproteobacteria bacterium]|nr:6,7-dimethyl-8-ribityllumazine synthase [Deltaproteobacteria bacterium]